MSTVVERKPSVSAEKKLVAYIQGRREGKTNKQIAESLGMNESSFSVAISQLKKKFAADAAEKRGKGETVVNPFEEIAKLKVARGSKVNVFDNASLMAALDTPEVETVSEVTAS